MFGLFQTAVCSGVIGVCFVAGAGAAAGLGAAGGTAGFPNWACVVNVATRHESVRTIIPTTSFR
jgi:hypothetical protein